MKLKRLLSGVTAAIMALSSVAVASFTSVSASELADNAPYQWTGKWQKSSGAASPDDDTREPFKTDSTKGNLVAEDWGSGWQMKISGFSLDGMTNPTIEVELEGTDTFQVGLADDEGGWLSEVGNGNSGQSVLLTGDNIKDSYLISTGGATGIITKVSIYDDPNPPAQPEAFSSITYNCTVIEGGDTTVTFADTDGNNASDGVQVGTSGDFKVDRTFSISRISLTGLGVIAAAPNAVKVKVNSIVVNKKYTFDVGLEIDSASQYDNALPHTYRDDGRAEVIYTTDGAYIAGGSTIKLMIGDAPEAPPAPTNPTAPSYAGTTYDAQLSYCDKQISFDARGNEKTYGGPIAEIGGTYTLGINISDFKNWSDQVASGVTCLYIDILGMAAGFGANAEVGVNDSFESARALAISKGINVKDLSIIVDGKEFYKYKDSDVFFGDFEAKGNLRIDLVNQYSGVEVPDDLNAQLLFLEAADKLEVKFTITTPLTPKPATPTVNKPTTRPTTNKVDAAKKAAEAKVKNAKIKNLTVKSKAKKKISVSWKKVSKVNGYQVQVAKKKDFKKKNIVLSKFTSKAKLTAKSPKIKSKKAYFVRVRAYATYKDAKNKAIKVYGKFSAKKKVKVK